MKQLLAIFILGLLISCSPDGVESKKAEIQKYKKKVKAYNEKIAELEKEVGANTTELIPKTALAIEVKHIVPAKFSRYFEVTGYMEAMQDASISPEINGQVERVHVKRGARVNKGELLLKLNTDLTEKNIEELKINLELATRLYEKQKELWEQNTGSEMQYLEVKSGKEALEARLATLEKQLEMAHVTAPFSGIVDHIMVKQGEMAAPGMQLLRLVNLGSMRVSARVSEAYLNHVKKNDEVELRFASYPDVAMKAQISRLGEVIDQETRTFTLEVILQNKNQRLKPNMLTTVRISDYTEEHAMVVPSIVIKEDFNGSFLYRTVADGNNTIAEKVYVERGITVQDQTMIVSGINAGDKVIVKGYNLVSDGTAVKINDI